MKEAAKGKTEMTIGQLALESSTDSQTIRYYERLGLIAEPLRSKSNYRIYDSDGITRLHFITKSQRDRL